MCRLGGREEVNGECDGEGVVERVAWVSDRVKSLFLVASGVTAATKLGLTPTEVVIKT